MAIGPSAREPMHPLDDVVSCIHRVGALRKNVDPKCAGSPSGSLKRVVPPARALDQCGPNRFGRASIDVILNRLDRYAGLRAARILLDQAVAHDEALFQGRAQRRGIVPVREWKVAGARIEAPRRIARTWQLEKRVVLAQRKRVRIRRHLGDERAARGLLRGECQNGFDFGVLGKHLGRIDGDDRPRGIEFVGALFHEGFGNLMHVAQKEVGRVHQNGPSPSILPAGSGSGTFGGHREAAENRLRKRLAHRQLFGRILRRAAKLFIGPHQQDLGTKAFETDQLGRRYLAAVEPQVIGTDALGERIEIQHVDVELRYFQIQPAVLGVPVKRQESRHVAHPGGFRLDRRHAARRRGLRGGGRRGRAEDRRDHYHGA